MSNHVRCDELTGGHAGMTCDEFDRLQSSEERLIAACEAVLACPTCHDESGHAYLKVDARSIFSTAVAVRDAVEASKPRTVIIGGGK